MRSVFCISLVICLLTPLSAKAAREDIRSENITPFGPTYAQAVEEICQLYVFPPSFSKAQFELDRESVTCTRFDRDGNSYWFSCSAKYKIKVQSTDLGQSTPAIHYENGNVKIDLSNNIKGVINTRSIIDYLKSLDNLNQFTNRIKDRVQGNLKKTIEEMPGAQLKTYLESLPDGAQLSNALEIVDGPTLNAGMRILDPDTLRVAMRNIDRPTLVAAVIRIDADTLRHALPHLNGRRLKFALENVDRATLLVCFDKGMGPDETDAALIGSHKIDEATFEVLWNYRDKLSQATRMAIEARRTPAGS